MFYILVVILLLCHLYLSNPIVSTLERKFLYNMEPLSTCLTYLLLTLAHELPIVQIFFLFFKYVDHNTFISAILLFGMITSYYCMAGSLSFSSQFKFNLLRKLFTDCPILRNSFHPQSLPIISFFLF